MRKKALSPAARREEARRLSSSGLCSARAACRILKLARSTCRYRGRPPTEYEASLHRRLEELSGKHPRYGYRRIAALLRQEGWNAGKRLVQRWRRNEGLRSAAHEAQAGPAGRFHGPADEGDASRACVDVGLHRRRRRAGRALKSRNVLEWLGRAIREHGAPEHLRSDNGPEFIAKAVQQWLRDNGVKTLHIDPGSPWQNGFVESFHGRFRDECLNREQLHTLTEARVVIEDCRRDYNRHRPHSRLGHLSPVRFARQELPSPVAVGLRPPSTGDGQPQLNH